MGHLQRAHSKIRNQRADSQHKLARDLVDNHGLICSEKLAVKGPAGGMHSKQVHDAGWASFLDKLAYKAEEAARPLAPLRGVRVVGSQGPGVGDGDTQARAEPSGGSSQRSRPL